MCDAHMQSVIKLHLPRCNVSLAVHVFQTSGIGLLQMIAGGKYGELATQILTALPLAYICSSAYYSLFKLVIFSYYRMVPGATEPRSLLLNAGQVCRFAAPLAFNFMHVIRMNEASFRVLWPLERNSLSSLYCLLINAFA